VTLSLTIGTIVIYKGRAYRFCGITPASIQPAMALLEDLRIGAWCEVPAVQLLTPTQSPITRNDPTSAKNLNSSRLPLRPGSSLRSRTPEGGK